MPSSCGHDYATPVVRPTQLSLVRGYGVARQQVMRVVVFQIAPPRFNEALDSGAMFSKHFAQYRAAKVIP